MLSVWPSAPSLLRLRSRRIGAVQPLNCVEQGAASHRADLLVRVCGAEAHRYYVLSHLARAFCSSRCTFGSNRSPRTFASSMHTNLYPPFKYEPRPATKEARAKSTIALTTWRHQSTIGDGRRKRWSRQSKSGRRASCSFHQLFKRKKRIPSPPPPCSLLSPYGGLRR